jgi:hypothetical protein
MTLLLRLQHLFLGLGLSLSVALAGDLPQGFESYLSRPDVFKVTPRTHPELNTDFWRGLKRSHIEAIPQLIELYPDREIYFLARDSELLYDLAKLKFKNDPKILKRIHLLNISRANMRAEHVKDYLAQEGISEAALKNGKKILFVDTGFSGTIPKTIANYFPIDLRDQLKTHLMSSSNPAHPSSRVFLTGLNPEAPRLNPGSMHGSIISYEHMPRYTDRSDRFFQVEGQWQPLSSIQSWSDGSVSKEKAQAYLEDLLFESQKPEFDTLFQERRKLWRDLNNLTTKAEAQSFISELLKRHPKDPFIESVVRDYLETVSIHLIEKSEIVPKLSELGLAEVKRGSSGALSSNKNELIKKHPQWAKILQDPETQIKLLVQSENFETLGPITDAIQDVEVDLIVYKNLGGKDSPKTRKFIQAMIEKGDQKVLSNLANYTFAQPHTAQMEDLIRLVIEKGDQNVLLKLAGYTFSKSHTAQMKDLIRLVIEKGDQKVLSVLASNTFSQSHTAHMKDLIRLVIEKGDQDVLLKLVGHTFYRPHTAQMKDLIRLVIEKGDQKVLLDLANFTFSQPHTAQMEDLIRLVIEKGDQKVLLDLANYTFSEPHTAQMEDLIRLVIEKGDQSVLSELAQRTFSNPHTAQMEDLIRLVIEKGDRDVLWSLASTTFAQPHTAPMEDLIRLVIEKGDQGVLAKLAFSTFSKPHTAQMEDLIRLLIQKGDQRVLLNLASNTFAHPHTSQMKELLRLVIEKGDQGVLAKLAGNTLIRSHWQTLDGKILKEATTFKDPAVRKKFLDKNFGTLSAITDAAHKGSVINPSDVIEFDQNKFTVIKYVDEGKRGKVYQIKDTHGKLYALKVAKDQSPETLLSLGQELKKNQLYKKYNLSHAHVVSSGKDYVIKDWVEGVRGDEWMKRWVKNGAPTDSPELKALKKFIDDASKRGVYVGDLNPKNLIWNKYSWVIVDSGSIQEGKSLKEALGRYAEKFSSRWGKSDPCIAQKLSHLFLQGI